MKNYGTKLGYHIVTMCAVLTLAILGGCATAPGGSPPSSNDAMVGLAIQSATLVAVDRVVSRDHATPAEASARALKIVNVASALKALGGDKLSTLPLIKSALDPLLDSLNLSPLERSQADLLVSALVTVGLERVDVDKYIARVEVILDAVIQAASAYIPAEAPPPTL